VHSKVGKLYELELGALYRKIQSLEEALKESNCICMQVEDELEFEISQCSSLHASEHLFPQDQVHLMRVLNVDVTLHPELPTSTASESPASESSPLPSQQYLCLH